ncbi:hypothetical protein ABH947_005156 [Bacillus sp. RC206]
MWEFARENPGTFLIIVVAILLKIDSIVANVLKFFL